MKKFILIFGILVGFSGKCMAATESYDKGYSSFTVSGFRCSTGSVANIVGAFQPSVYSGMNGFIVGGYRISNQDSSESVWIGGPSVSTSAVNALGEKIVPSASVVYNVSRAVSASTNVQIYCKAEDAAGSGGVIVSVAIFGYK